MLLWKLIPKIHRRQREWGKKLSRGILSDVIKAYSLLYRLDLYTSKVNVLFQNIYSQTYLKKKTNKQNQRETHKKQPPQPNQQLFTPEKAQLHSHRPDLIQKLMWHWRLFHGVGSLLAQTHSRLRRAQGSGSTEFPSQGTQPISQCFSVGWVLKNLQEEPLAAAKISSSQNTCWKFLWVLVPILLLSCWATSAKWPLWHTILNMN